MRRERIAAILAAGCLLTGVLAPAGAEQAPSIQVDGVVAQVVPALRQGRAYLPQEALASLLGARAERQGEQVLLVRDDWEAAVPVVYDGDGGVWLPVRATASALGYEVGWDREARRVILADLAQAGEKKWSLAAVEAQAGLFSSAATQWAEELASAVDPGRPLSAIPLTDGETAAELVAKGSQALVEGEGSFRAGETDVTVLREGEETTLTVTLTAEELLPARRLGVTGQVVTVTLKVDSDSADALVTLGEWRATARWTA